MITLPFDNSLLQLIFNGVAVAGIADVPAAPLADFFVSLHSGDPGHSGDQTVNEVDYDTYARMPVSRTSAGWVVEGSNVRLADILEFAAPGVLPEPITALYMGVGSLVSGVGVLYYTGKLSPPIRLAVGVEPRILDAQVGPSQPPSGWA